MQIEIISGENLCFQKRRYQGVNILQIPRYLIALQVEILYINYQNTHIWKMIEGYFSKNTYYRFLKDKKTNWLRSMSLLSKVVAYTFEPLTAKDCMNTFAVNDRLLREQAASEQN